MTNGDSRNERLDSWKEIARYLNRSERTVQRWERESGLPIRRVKSAKDAGSVYAMRSEIDAWLLEGNVAGDGQAFDRPRGGTSKRKSTLLMLAGLAALLALTALAATLRLGPWTLPSTPTPVALTRDSGLTADPVVSADGKWLAYTSDRDGGEDLDIWIQPFPFPDGAAPRQITNKPGIEIRPDISPDGSAITYSTGFPEMDIFVVSLADGSERRLGTGDIPRFSPDGSLISFVSHWDSPAGSALFVVGTDGGEPRSIRPDFNFFRGLAAWLPDGEHLLFVGRRYQSDKLTFWITPIDGGSAVDTGFGPIDESPIKTLGVAGGLRWITGTNRAVVADTLVGDLWHLGFSAKTFQFDGGLRRIPGPYPAGAQYPNSVLSGESCANGR